MTTDYFARFTNYAEQTAENSDDAYIMFSDKVSSDFQDSYDRELAEEIARHEAKLAALALKKSEQQSALNKLSRFRSTAIRIEYAIMQSVEHNIIVDVHKSIAKEVDSLTDVSGLDLDDDNTYKMLFSKALMLEVDLDVTDKEQYNALLTKLEGNNTAILKKRFCDQAQDRFRILHDEPYGPKFAERVIAGFAEVQDILEKGANALNLEVEDCYASSLGTFSIMSTHNFAQRMQKAMKKIAAASLFDDMAKFSLDTRIEIDQDLIDTFKAIDFSEDRLSRAHLPAMRSEQLSSLQADFINALEQGKNFRYPAREISTISVELQNRSYVINGPI